MKTVSSIIGELENTAFFLEWKKNNPKTYLSSIFAMAQAVESLSKDQWNELDWLFSYYNPDTDAFSTFNASGVQGGNQEAFTKQKKLPELQTESVKVEAWQAVGKAEEIRLEKYKGDVASLIVILQQLSDKELFGNKARASRPVWNLTYITRAYKVINIKIDAESGKALCDNCSGVMDFMQDGKEA
jgi:hypothetical protein